MADARRPAAHPLVGAPLIMCCDDADRQVTVHACPPEGSGIMPCCGRAPFEVPGTALITMFGPLVTCAGRLG